MFVFAVCISVLCPFAVPLFFCVRCCSHSAPAQSLPFQRVAQYVSLAEAIRRDYPSYYATDNYKDFETLSLGCIGVRELKIAVNEFNHDKYAPFSIMSPRCQSCPALAAAAQATYALHREVFQLATVLTPKPKDFVFPDRRFKRETEVNEWEGGTLKPRTLIFLSDALISVKKKNSERYNLKSIVTLKVRAQVRLTFDSVLHCSVVLCVVSSALSLRIGTMPRLTAFPADGADRRRPQVQLPGVELPARRREECAALPAVCVVLVLCYVVCVILCCMTLS